MRRGAKPVVAQQILSLSGTVVVCCLGSCNNAPGVQSNVDSGSAVGCKPCWSWSAGERWL
jgi:hypothetical protein